MLPSLPLPSAQQPATEPEQAASPAVIREGDLVIVYENPSSMKAVTVKSGNRYDNKFGSFPHKDWLGLRYGSKAYSKTGSKGWIHLLAPTPDLWTQVLRHRTQILYVADISMTVTYLELRPGCVVLESGTGSGSLTHSLVRAVAPKGHVHTFEFHPERATEAAKEFQEHGLTPCVTVRQRNIEELGFPCGAHTESEGMIDLTGQADAVFLDLPAPHKVVPSAARCLKPDGRLCSFSPCIEQVQKTCEALERHGFHDLQTYECLVRAHEVHTERLQDVYIPDSVGVGTKRPRDEPQNEGSQGAQDQGVCEERSGPNQQGKQQHKAGGRMCVTTHPALKARGHTGYLTFARKFVSVAGDGTAAVDAAEKGGDGGDV